MNGTQPKHRRRQRLGYAIAAYTALVALAVAFLFPLLWVAALSFDTRMRTLGPAPDVWRPTFENYTHVLRQADFFRALFNSAVTSTGAVALSLAVGAPAAYAFARFSFRGDRLIFLSLLVMRMLPPVAVLLPMFVVFSRLGMINTRVGVILAYTTFTLPLVVWVMRGFFEDLPREIEENAWIDGASRFAAFRTVVLPLARPGLVATAILSALLAWNDFLFAAVLTNRATRTLPVLLATYAGSDSGIEWGPMTASGVLVILPVVLFTFVIQRHLVAGLSSGALKG
jgi:multiple sugar transport system permease protein